MSEGPQEIPETIEVIVEQDIVLARGRAHVVALRMGATRLIAQRAATIVSELTGIRMAVASGVRLPCSASDRPSAL